MMYRKPRFLELLQEIREEMSRECDYDMDLFAQRLNNGAPKPQKAESGRRSPSVRASRADPKPKAKARRKS